jgi:hypothetical protein
MHLYIEVSIVHKRAHGFCLASMGHIDSLSSPNSRRMGLNTISALGPVVASVNGHHDQTLAYVVVH